MSDNSSIEWTDATWNPVTGCTRVSAGCDNCYAVTMTRRLAAMGNEKYTGLVNEGKGHFNGVVKCHPDELDKPLRWRKPRRIFVNSMSDLFHEGVPFEFIERVFEVMREARQHEFQVLTKRPERACEYWDWRQNEWLGPSRNSVWPDNVWIGTSVENQETADERIPHLLKIPAAVRWLSMEPLLGPVDLRHIRFANEQGGVEDWNALDAHLEYPYVPGVENEAVIHWVVVGGESGPGARPMHPDWARSIRDQCVEAGVAFHFKQWGAWAPDCLCDTKEHHPTVVRPSPGKPGVMFRCGKHRAGRLLDGREWNHFPK